jgi:OOP family OmpA-OmpF porin
MHKFTKVCLIFLSSILFIAPQSIKSETKYVYMGVDYLKSSIETGVTNISSKLEEDDSGYSIYLGWPINESFDFEMSYQDFGEASLSGNSGDQFIFDNTTYEFNQTASLKVSARSFGYALKSNIELKNGMELYGKLGLHKWDTDLNITSTTVTANADDDGTDMFYGAGLQYILQDNLNARIGFSRYEFDGDDVDSINFGISISF